MIDDFGAIPLALRERSQWVVWRYQHRPGSSKPQKIPFNPREPGRKADVTDPQSWGTFEEAVAAERDSAQRSVLGPVDGKGFVLTADDPLCGLDFDDCIGSGDVHPAAAEFLDELQGAYKEVSPSGTGMHAIIIADAKHNPRHKTKKTPWGGGFECYDRGRFFTITGGGEGVPEPQQAQHDQIVARLLPPPQTTNTGVGGGGGTRPGQSGEDGRNGRRVDVDDQELVRRMFAARNGAKVQALYNGDISAYENDDSNADLALCGHLAFWTAGDPDRIDSMFRGSKLMRDKWDSPRGDGTYGHQTIEKAIQSCTRFYTPSDVRKRTGGTGTSTDEAGEAPASAELYREAPDGLVWRRQTKDGNVDVRLANFTAQIVTDTLVDYGSGETKHLYTVQARLPNARRRELEVPAGSFPGMKWVADLGAHAWLEPGPGLCDRARHAIQYLSAPTDRRVYAHTGWTKLNGTDVYLHAGGGIGPDGPVPDIEVRLPEQLALLELPTVDDSELRECVRTSLELLELGPVDAMAPLLSSTYRAPLGAVDLSTHADGPTGAFKTELAALSQQHFGAGFDSRHLPASWSSTANSISDLAFVAKDVLLVIDDFAPAGSKYDVQKQHRDAERVLRGQGNHAGRGRMNADGSQRPARPPRGLILSTGEDVPGQQSLRARIVVVDVDAGAIDPAKLLVAQTRGDDGTFAKVTTGFVRWLAARGIDRIQRHVRDRSRRLRESVIAGEHRRSVANLAQLACGLEVFLTFAAETGAITLDDANVTWERCWLALMRAAATQSQHQRETDPPRVFLSLLAGAITSERAYLEAAEGGLPERAEMWGWRDQRPAAGADRIGWVKDDDVYLEPHAAWRAAQRFADDSAQSLGHSKREVQRMLHEHGLTRISNERGGRLTVQRPVLGNPNKRVLDLTTAGIRIVQGAEDTDHCGPDPHDRSFPPIPPMSSVTRAENAD